MKASQTSRVMAAAVGAVRELMEQQISANGADATALQAGLEELSVLWEEVQDQGQHLARERQRFEDLFEFLPEACILTDTFGHIREANRAALELLKVPGGSLLGKPLSAFVALEERETLRNHLSGLFAADYLGKAAWPSTLLPRDGRRVAATLSVRAIHPPRPSDLCWLIRTAAPAP